MKWISIILFLISSVSFAQKQSVARGGTGGGGVLANARASQEITQVIYHAGQDGELIKFEFGQKVDNEWLIQKGEITNEELVKRPDVLKALEESQLKRDWAKLN